MQRPAARGGLPCAPRCGSEDGRDSGKAGDLQSRVLLDPLQAGGRPRRPLLREGQAHFSMRRRPLEEFEDGGIRQSDLGSQWLLGAEPASSTKAALARERLPNSGARYVPSSYVRIREQMA